MPTTPICITIAGSDSCAGAGIQADIKTFAQLGCYGMSVITASTSPTHLGVNDVHALPVKHVEAQLLSLLKTYEVSAIKTGMLASSEHIEMISDVLSNYADIPVVCDPVLSTSSGANWSTANIKTALLERLAPNADLLTPNLAETNELFSDGASKEQPDKYYDHLIESVTNFCRETDIAILLKGGHADLREEQVTDRLFAKDKEPKAYSHPRVKTGNIHGTGCTLASAITSFIALGYSMEDSVALAVQYLDRVIGQSKGFLDAQAREPAQNLPMNHFYTE